MSELKEKYIVKEIEVTTISLDNCVKAAYKGGLMIAINSVGRNKTNTLCRRCGKPLTAAYHEERIYSIHCAECGTVMLVEAESFNAAVNKGWW